MSNIDYESTVLIEINVIEAKYYPPLLLQIMPVKAFIH